MATKEATAPKPEPKPEPKPKRRTRERILEVSLRLFNDFGEPNVTTQLIADEMEISPGNLYYHFHSKDEILEAIFEEFERRITQTLAAPARGVARVEDIWLFMQMLFDNIWTYRFLYRDLHDLVSRNRIVETHFNQILAHKMRTAALICEGLVTTGEMKPTSRAELETLAVNMTVLATHWLSFEFVRNPRQTLDQAALTRGAFQVMSLAAPYLDGRALELYRKMSGQYAAP